MESLSSEQLVLIKQILRKHLSSQATVWVFGSRAKGKSKKYSDIDLAIDAGQQLASTVLTDLAFDFEYSDLPYKVDVVDWAKLSDEFKSRILAGHIVQILPD